MFDRIFTNDVRTEEPEMVIYESDLVDMMLDRIRPGPWKVYHRHLGPACGNGAFLIGAMKRKLLSISELPVNEQPAAVIHALGTTWGVDISLENVRVAKFRLLKLCRPILEPAGGRWMRLAESVVSWNIVAGNFIKSTRGIPHTDESLKRMKPVDRTIYGIDGPLSEDIEMLVVQSVDHQGFHVCTFSLRHMLSEYQGHFSPDDLDLWLRRLPEQ